MESRVLEIQEAFGLDNLNMARRRIVDEPEPGHVLLRMRAASLNYRDVLVAEGSYNPRQPLPLIPCSDGVGEIIACGAGVKNVAVGSRVATCFAQGWLTDPFPFDFKQITLGGPLDGTLTEYMHLRSDGVVHVPDYLTDEEAATLPCAALTAWSALVEQGRVKPDDVIVVQGTGGVALFALQFASSIGAAVIVTSKSDEKLERARSLGAAHTVNYVTEQEWSRNVKKLTDGRGADHVVELGGSATLRQSVRAVRSGGFVSMIGVLGGPVAEVDLPLVVMRNVRLQGVTVGPRDAFDRMVSFMEDRKLRPVVDDTYRFSDARQAFHRLKSAGHFGKVCVRF